MKASSKKILISIIVILVAGLAYGGYVYYELDQKSQSQQETISNLESDIEDLESEKQDMQEQIDNMQGEIIDLKSDKLTLVEALQGEMQESQEFQEELKAMSKEVEEFKKLQSIDEEILKKYSKTFFLNENYEPSSLTEIDTEYLCVKDEAEEIHSKVYPFLRSLVDAAERRGVEICIRSGYRSFGEQSDIKNKFEVIYGEGTANAFSAEQGYSEHQLGTTVDFSTPSLNGAVEESFEGTEAYEWLQNNAYKYGFVLSYPEGNQYYVYEPWHWRFVGQELSSDLNSDDMYFYEMDQREIDQYLIDVFE